MTKGFAIVFFKPKIVLIHLGLINGCKKLYDYIK